MASPLLGHLWETLVHGELQRLLAVVAPGRALYFWALHGSNEVDFVLDEGGRFRLFEAKLTERPGREEVKGIRQFQSFYGDDAVGESFVVCRTKAEFSIDGKTSAIGLLDLTEHLG